MTCKWTYPAHERRWDENYFRRIGLGMLADEEFVRIGTTQDIVGDFLIVPEFLGNRAPFADPEARAIIASLPMQTDLANLVSLYLAGMCGLGYGLRQIIEAQRGKGIEVDTIVVSGGAGETELARQILADTTGLAVVHQPSPLLREWHDRRYDIFCRMQSMGRELTRAPATRLPRRVPSP